MQAYLLIEWCASLSRGPFPTLGVDPGRPSHKILLFESSHRFFFERHRRGAAWSVEALEVIHGLGNDLYIWQSQLDEQVVAFHSLALDAVATVFAEEHADAYLLYR